MKTVKVSWHSGYVVVGMWSQDYSMCISSLKKKKKRGPGDFFHWGTFLLCGKVIDFQSE